MPDAGASAFTSAAISVRGTEGYGIDGSVTAGAVWVPAVDIVAGCAGMVACCVGIVAGCVAIVVGCVSIVAACAGMVAC